MVSSTIEKSPTIIFIILKSYCQGCDILSLLSASKELRLIGREVLRISLLTLASQQYFEKQEMRARIHSRINDPSQQLCLSICKVSAIDTNLFGISVYRVLTTPLVIPNIRCFSNLRSLSLRYQLSIVIIDDLLLLEELKLSLCSDLEVIGSNLPRLSTLVVTQCPSLKIISSPTIQQLITLEISQCRRLFPDYTALTSLKHLSLADISRFTFSDSFLSVLPHLDSLRISGLNNFIELIESRSIQSYLKVLEISGTIQQVSTHSFPSLSKLIVHSQKRNEVHFDISSSQLKHLSIHYHIGFFTISNYSHLTTLELIDCQPAIPIDLTPFGSIRNLILKQSKISSFKGLGKGNYSVIYEEYSSYEFRNIPLDFSPLQTIPFVTIRHSSKLIHGQQLASEMIKHLTLDYCDQIVDISMLGMIETLELRRLKMITSLQGLESVKELIVLDCFRLTGSLSLEHQYHDKMVFDSDTALTFPLELVEHYQIERSREGYYLFLQKRVTGDINIELMQNHNKIMLIRNGRFKQSASGEFPHSYCVIL